jgi:chemotaxis methyl-accepting protein methylase
LSTFNQQLKERVDELIYDSLARFGILALGAEESLDMMPSGVCYNLLDGDHRLYQKVSQRHRSVARG